MLSWREEDRFRSDWTKAVVTVVTVEFCLAAVSGVWIDSNR